jgi:hypothetical protein
MVSLDPFTNLDPVFPIDEDLLEALITTYGLNETIVETLNSICLGHVGFFQASLLDPLTLEEDTFSQFFITKMVDVPQLEMLSNSLGFHGCNRS